MRLFNDTIALAVGGLLLFAATASAQPDLRILSLQINGQARQGDCNRMRITVRNAGNQFTNAATIDIFLATFPAAKPNQHRAEKKLSISPLQPGRQVTFNVKNVTFNAQGSMQLQALVDGAQQIAESNENNNTLTQAISVNGSCAAPAPRKRTTQTGKGCDLELAFSQPSGSTIAAHQDNVIQLSAKNVGSARCNAVQFRLYRYQNSTASGYSTAIGGTRNIQQINPLNPGQQQTFAFTDNPNATGTFSYAPKTIGRWSDANGKNHHPKKTVEAR